MGANLLFNTYLGGGETGQIPAFFSTPKGNYAKSERSKPEFERGLPISFYAPIAVTSYTPKN